MVPELLTEDPPVGQLEDSEAAIARRYLPEYRASPSVKPFASSSATSRFCSGDKATLGSRVALRFFAVPPITLENRTALLTLPAAR
jgi:hypothetical protein